MTTTLAVRITAARSAQYPSVSQRELARRLGMSPAAVNLWEKGKTEPGAENIARIAQLFGVTTDWLLGIDNTDLPKEERISPPIFTVPVVPPTALLSWNLSARAEILQTNVAYPQGTAAGVLVSTDALSSACPTGSYAVVSNKHLPAQGSLVMVAVGKVGEPLLRRYVRDGSNELLVADDVRYPTHRLDDGARIIGKVVEVTVRKTLP